MNELEVIQQELEARRAAGALPSQRRAEINAKSFADAQEIYQRSRTPEVLRAQAKLHDAERIATLQARAKPGELIEVFETDRAGRKISKFYGDPEAAWGPFKYPARRIIGFNWPR